MPVYRRRKSEGTTVTGGGKTIYRAPGTTGFREIEKRTAGGAKPPVKAPPQLGRARTAAPYAQRRVRPPTLPTKRKPMARGFVPPRPPPPTPVGPRGGGRGITQPPKPTGRISPKMQWLTRMTDRDYSQKDIDVMLPKKPWLRQLSAPEGVIRPGPRGQVIRRKAGRVRR